MNAVKPVRSGHLANLVEDAIDAAGLTAPAWSAGAVGIAAWLFGHKTLRPVAIGLGLVSAVGAAITVIPRWPNAKRITTPPDTTPPDTTPPETASPEPAPPKTLRLVAANVWVNNPNRAAVADDLLSLNADVLVISELTSDLHARLIKHFPHSMTVELDTPGTDFAHGVYARYPLGHAAHEPGIAGQAIVTRVEGPEPFWLFALHLPRPVIFGPVRWGCARPKGLRKAVDAVVSLAATKNEPVVITGDLNLSDRTPGYRALARTYRDAMRNGWAGSTFGNSLFWKATLLRIDHLFVSPSWSVTSQRRVEITGSDHLGLVADLTPT